MVWLAGKKVRLAKGRANKRQAEQRLLELLLERSKNPPPDDPHPTIASIIDLYLASAGRRLASSTLAIRRPYLQSFAEAHGWRLVHECKRHHMESCLDAHPTWKSDWTKSSAFRNVQVAFNWAVRSGHLDLNPFHGVSHRQGAPRRDISAAEFQALLRGSQNSGRWNRPTPAARFRQVLVFLWRTGCRPKEAATLEWTHVDFEKNLLVLPEHKTSRTQRVPRPRVVPLDPVVAKLLYWLRARSDGPRVFVHCRNRPWTKDTLAQRVRRARLAAGIPEDATLYGLRHAFGTRGVVNGCDLKTLSTLMGHTTTRMTEHYLHLSNQHQHLAAAMRLVNARH
jgi:integrase